MRSAMRLAALLVAGLALSAPARAEMIATPQLLSSEPQRASVDAFLAREDVRRRLEELGVDPATAAARADDLTAAEVQELASRIDTLPAGAGISTIELLLIIIIIILLV